MARIPAKKTTARKAAPRKTTARKATARKASPRTAAPRATTAAATTAAGAAPAGSNDLAGSLRTMLGSMDSEIRAVSALSEKIDGLVRQLNDAREEQAKRLLVLDALRTSVEDANLGAFLDKAIRPRKTRVEEVIPKRLTQ